VLSFLGLVVWSFGIAIGPSMMPGPVSVAVVTEGLRRGLRVGPLISTGHALAELAMVIALALGMGQMLRYPLLAAAIAILGGALLLWIGGAMAWGAARRKPRLLRPDESAALGAGRSLIGIGIAATVGNPFWYLWWIGVGGGYVLSTQEQGMTGVAAFYLGHIAADYAWNTLTASVAATGRSWLSDRVYQVLLLVCGLFLAYTGLRFVVAGVGMLLG
jgi:threonine/homoserine/homoserine lactone efflux protein